MIIIKTKCQFNKNMVGILLNNSLHSILTIFVNTFLIAYILNISLGNFFNVALYYIVAHTTMLIFYPFVSYLLKKINPTYMLRFSTLLYIPILIALVILKENITNYIIPFSISYYMVQSLFWCANNTLINEKIKNTKLSNFSTYDTIFKNIISIIIPVIFGSIIDISSIQVIAIVVSCLAVIEMFSTFLIDKSELSNNKLDYKGYFKECYNSSNKKSFKYLYTGEILNGLRASISTLVTILIVLTFKSNTSLGAINSIISIITMIVLYLTNKFSTPKMYKCFLPITLIIVVSTLCLLFNINKPLLIFFNVCYNGLLEIIIRSYNIRKNGLIKAINQKKYIIENQTMVEECLNIGRLIFYITLISVSSITDIWVYKLLLAFSLVGLALFGVIGYLADKEYQKVLISQEFKKDEKEIEKSNNLLKEYNS